MKHVEAARGVLGAALLAGCGPEINHSQAVYVLVDTSGTYAKEVTKAQSVVNYLLGSLQPGDSLAVGRVKSRSFSEKDIVAKVTLDMDPIQANGQKRKFGEEMSAFTKSAQGDKGSRYTDITGGMMQAAEFLTETGRTAQDDHRLLRHAGRARLQDGARFPHQARRHPHHRAQRHQARHRQRRSAPLREPAGVVGGARPRRRRHAIGGSSTTWSTSSGCSADGADNHTRCAGSRHGPRSEPRAFPHQRGGVSCRSLFPGGCAPPR